MPKQDGFQQNYHAFEWNHCIDIFNGFVYLDQASYVLDVSDIKCGMKDAVMNFAARVEEINSVPDCAAHLKANGGFMLIFLKKTFYSYFLCFSNIIEGNAITV